MIIATTPFFKFRTFKLFLLIYNVYELYQDSQKGIEWSRNIEFMSVHSKHDDFLEYFKRM